MEAPWKSAVAINKETLFFCSWTKDYNSEWRLGTNLMKKKKKKKKKKEIKEQIRRKKE